MAASANFGNLTYVEMVQRHRARGERERLFGSRERREGKLKITFPFYGKGTGIQKLLREGKGRKFEACNPGNPGKSRESYKKQG